MSWRSYDEKFQAEMAKQILNGRSAYVLAKHHGMSVSTLYRWRDNLLKNMPNERKIDNDSESLNKQVEYLRSENDRLRKALILILEKQNW
ncbi:transposase [Pseudomonadota bacterium]